jgi:hypothetical protein
MLGLPGWHVCRTYTPAHLRIHRVFGSDSVGIRGFRWGLRPDQLRNVGEYGTPGLLPPQHSVILSVLVVVQRIHRVTTDGTTEGGEIRTIPTPPPTYCCPPGPGPPAPPSPGTRGTLAPAPALSPRCVKGE